MLALKKNNKKCMNRIESQPRAMQLYSVAKQKFFMVRGVIPNAHTKNRPLLTDTSYFTDRSKYCGNYSCRLDYMSDSVHH